MSLTKITDKTFPTTKGIKPIPVYAEKFNSLIDELETSLETVEVVTDTISESTSGSGITADGVKLKDGTVLSKAATEVVAATNVITAAETGTTFFLNHATEFVSTLPAPAAGLQYTFIVSAAPASASYTIVTTSSSNIIVGNIVESEDAGGSGDSEISGGDTITFVDGVAVKGDKVEVICDGTNWYAYGVCKAHGGITITTAS